MTATRNVYCKACGGTGAEGGKLKVCDKCKGKGVVNEIMQVGPMQMQV